MALCQTTSMTSMTMMIPKKEWVIRVPLPHMVKYDRYEHIAAKQSFQLNLPEGSKMCTYVHIWPKLAIVFRWE